MHSLLALCQPADYAFLVGLVESPFNLTDDASLRAALRAYEQSGTDEARAILDERLEQTIGYLGSADLAYWARQLRGQTPGVPFDEIVGDVARALKTAVPPRGQPLRNRVEAVVEAHVARTFEEMTPEQQRAMLLQLGVEEMQVSRFLKTSAGVFAFPLLVQAFDTFVIQGVLKNIVFSTIAKLVGRRMSQGLFGVLAARFPWWLRFVGPAAWTLSVGWTVFDIQKPALRKTVPVVLYLGLVSHRERAGGATGAHPEAGPERGQ